jgi:hypothetical protein
MCTVCGTACLRICRGAQGPVHFAAVTLTVRAIRVAAGQREFLIATTNIVNGDSLLMSLMDEIPVANPLHPAARDRKRSHTLPSPD